MGSLSYNRAVNRFYEALEQRIEASSEDEEESTLREAIAYLTDVVMDEQELHRVAFSLAEDPHDIDWPYPVCELCTRGPEPAEFVADGETRVCLDHADELETGRWDDEKHEVEPLNA